MQVRFAGPQTARPALDPAQMPTAFLRRPMHFTGDLIRHKNGGGSRFSASANTLGYRIVEEAPQEIADLLLANNSRNLLRECLRQKDLAQRAIMLKPSLMLGF
ncbi:MAG: hypothetical protein M0T84_02900 [Betaproteobacteria bacterium]|nr:hypothetical protein [Betaproteobacteria bacterium]